MRSPLLNTSYSNDRKHHHFVCSQPGDIVKVTSSRGHHLVQIVDLMMDVRQMSTKKLRKSKTAINKIGVLRGALSDQKQRIEGHVDIEQQKSSSPLFYKIETM